ncbi:MAG: recombinase family protein, partial [Brevundimonas sp.]
MTTAPAFIAYYRVSTQAQGRSGLGLEAQREAVARHAATLGGQVVQEFTEVESGKRNDRPPAGGRPRRLSRPGRGSL